MNKLKILLITVFSVMALIGVAVIVALNNYMSKGPVIYPKSPVYATVGETLSVYQLADFENAASVIILEGIKSSIKNNAQVIKNNQALFVGDDPAYITVNVSATGENSETRYAEIEIIVKERKNKE